MLKITDIKSAFQLDREVYIKPPVESETAKGFVWKLSMDSMALRMEQDSFI